MIKENLTKVISHFDQLGLVWVEAVLQDKTEIARLSNSLSLPHHQLYEVWLMSEGEGCFSRRAIQKACFNSIEELLIHFDPERSTVPSYAQGKRMSLLANFASNLHFQDADFDYSILGLTPGQVISVVFGSKPAMRMVYERGLRFKK